MIRIKHAVILGLILFATNERALTVSAASGPVKKESPIQVILRLADPPVSRVAAGRLAGRPRRPGAPDVHDQAYCRTLKARQDSLEQRLRPLGARVIARYRMAFNGVCVDVLPSLLPRIAQLPGVVNVALVQPVQRNNSYTAPFVGAATVWSQFSARGEGVRVAVIDSGIDYTHRDFGGPGTPAAFQRNNPTAIEPGSFPTPKVIGGYDFVGDDYPSGGPKPDRDPLDPAANGHGTRIAGIIAGLGVPGQLAPGIAPAALLLAYKIYGRTGGSTQNIVLQALERAMDPNGDGSVNDHADVINISGGTSRQAADDPLVAAADNAAQLGAIVVGSAGNDGDNPYFVGGPGVAAGAISVGNSYGGGPIFDAVRVNTPLMGNLVAAEGALTAPLTPTGVTADLVYVGSASGGTSLLAAPQGRIALVDRDGRPYVDKVKACQQGGAVGIIVVNNTASPPTTMPGDRTGITIPGVMISRDDGARLKAMLSAGQRVNVTLSSQYQAAAPGAADRIDDASSRGPRRGDSLIKPDVVAPGVNIVSAAAGSGDRGIPDTGTSAAAPVVAGIAALLRQLHPDWSVPEIKAAIVNTAQPLMADGLPYPISRQGAGRVRADAAVAAQTVIIADDDTPSLSFGLIDALTDPVTRRITLSNKGATPQRFAARVEYLSPAGARGGIEISVETPDDPGGRITVPAGGSTDLSVTLSVHPDRLSAANPDEYDGFLTFIDDGDNGDTLRMPFLAVVRNSSAAEISSVSGSRLLLQNSHLGVAATAQVFGWVIDDPEDLPADGDIRAVGVRSLVGPTPATTRIEFAIATYRPWTTPFGPQFTLFLDRDGDGRADLTLSNDDAGLLAGATRSGVPGGVLKEASTGRVLAAVRLQAAPHGGAMVFSLTAAQLGLTRPARLTLWAQGMDPWRGDRQIDRTARGTFSPLQPELTATPPDVRFDHTASIDLQVDPSALSGLLVLYPQNSSTAQAQTLSLADAAEIAARRFEGSRSARG